MDYALPFPSVVTAAMNYQSVVKLLRSALYCYDAEVGIVCRDSQVKTPPECADQHGSKRMGIMLTHFSV